MMKNFSAMPWLLKLMTMSAFSVLGFVVGSVTTTSPIVVFGQPGRLDRDAECRCRPPCRANPIAEYS
jgi:hypothetical protein